MNSFYPPVLNNVPHSECLDPGALREVLSPSASLKWCRGLEPDGHFRHQIGSIDINTMRLVSDAGSAMEFLVEDTPNMHLLACFHGWLHLQTATGELSLAPNGCALLPSGLRRGNGHHSLASLTVSPQAVAAAAAAMAGLPGGLTLPVRDREVFPPLAIGPERPSASAIHGLLRHIDACLAVGPRLATLLGLDDVVHRTVAALRYPELLSEEPADLERWRERTGRNSFDTLLDYIRANLDQPLRLSDLEARSHYSRRALQYAFRERLNTTPKAWIREQRLKQALERFRGDGPRPSVTDVAMACGYVHVGHFSRDFKACFGINPSQARRG
jgi:AraC-like DNA-binding protein